MIKVSEAIIVEGKHDKIKLSQFVDGLIIDVGGFRIFKDKKKLELIKKIAAKNGIIIFTDSDNAGFMIRNYISGSFSDESKNKIKHAYIPDIYGKEKRKDKPSKEGKLGVEGMPEEVLRKTIESATNVETCKEKKGQPQITKLDLFEDGLSGGANSTEKRARLLKRLNLPENLTVNLMLGVLNRLFTRDEYKKTVNEI